jgi:phosphopantothenoylcysteine decarboxylase / phosphopantothenate---cysteine ligase
LRDEGASVTVVMTEASRHFVTPLSLEVASQNKVYTSFLDEPMAHIDLPSRADLMVIAPATANIISKFANGIADDLLSTCLLSFGGSIVIAPAMNWRMYQNRFFRENLNKVISSGAVQVGPEKGDLACGEEGTGRMSEVPEIVEAIKAELAVKDLAGEKIVVTAGPTREYLDPVRFISNRSSGKMGFAIARAARDRGAEVTLISGPTALRKPSGLKVIEAETAEEMMKSVKESIKGGTSVLIMAAAVADFSPVVKAVGKIEKADEMALQLRRTDDITAAAAQMEGKPFIIGFAAETGRHIERAREKMRCKGMDMVIFNDVTETGAGFDWDTNSVIIIDREQEKVLGLMSKDSVAEAILDRLVEIKA